MRTIVTASSEDIGKEDMGVVEVMLEMGMGWGYKTTLGNQTGL